MIGTRCSTIIQFQDRSFGHRQGRIAGHSGQLRWITIYATDITGWKRRSCTEGEDNRCDREDIFGAKDAIYSAE